MLRVRLSIGWNELTNFGDQKERELVRMSLSTRTRRKCFISYHHDDEVEVQQFIEEFDQARDVLIARGIGARMSGDIIDSTNDDYIKSQIRTRYLRDTSVTIVLIGRCTWARKFVDWEIAASLRNTSTATRSGLLAISLPSISKMANRALPARLDDNVNGEAGYARWWKYPSNSDSLADMIELAYELRSTGPNLAENSRQLRSYNSSC